MKIYKIFQQAANRLNKIYNINSLNYNNGKTEIFYNSELKGLFGLQQTAKIGGKYYEIKEVGNRHIAVSGDLTADAPAAVENIVRFWGGTWERIDTETKARIKEQERLPFIALMRPYEESGDVFRSTQLTIYLIARSNADKTNLERQDSSFDYLQLLRNYYEIELRKTGYLKKLEISEAETDFSPNVLNIDNIDWLKLSFNVEFLNNNSYICVQEV